MMKRVVALVVAGLLGACQALVPAVEAPTEPAGVVAPLRTAVLTGVAMVPNLRIQATSADLIANAAITLRDKEDKDGKDGKVRAAGLTNASGAFTLYQSTERFNPEVGEYYVLELSKYYTDPSTGPRRLSMRTIVQREAAGWTSITGATIAINPTTTALAKLVSQGQATEAEVIGTVSGGAFADIEPFGAWTAAALTDRVAAIQDLLVVDTDPISVTETVWTGDICFGCGDDLAKLVHLTKIDGRLEISGTSLAGIILPNLQEVTGDLVVMGNNELTNLAMRNLTAIGGDLTIIGNPELTNLDGLGQLTTVGRDLTIGPNPKLTNVDGLRQLATVGQDLSIALNLELTNLDGLGQLAAVGHNLTISGNPKLTNLDGLVQLTSIGDGLTVTNNDALPQAEADVFGARFPDAAPKVLAPNGT